MQDGLNPLGKGRGVVNEIDTSKRMAAGAVRS